jgi:predicted porin
MGTSYFIQKMNRQAMWTLAPNALSQSAIGIEGKEQITSGLDFVFQLEAGFDPYSLRLANSVQSEFENKEIPLNQQTANGDSNRAGQFYNSVGFLGLSAPTYGTLTILRQNALTLDGIGAYDPMALSYAFSPIGFSGASGGAGLTEDAHATTSVKYRFQSGGFRAAALYQFGGYQLDNGATDSY